MAFGLWKVLFLQWQTAKVQGAISITGSLFASCSLRQRCCSSPLPPACAAPMPENGACRAIRRRNQGETRGGCQNNINSNENNMKQPPGKPSAPIFETIVAGFRVKLPKKIGHLAFQAFTNVFPNWKKEKTNTTSVLRSQDTLKGLRERFQVPTWEKRWKSMCWIYTPPQDASGK